MVHDWRHKRVGGVCVCCVIIELLEALRFPKFALNRIMKYTDGKRIDNYVSQIHLVTCLAHVQMHQTLIYYHEKYIGKQSGLK